jgi:Ice-binding-like
LTDAHSQHNLLTIFQPIMYSSIIVATAICLAAFSNAIDIPLGECTGFSLQAGTAMTFNGALTTVYTGDIGVAPGNSLFGSFKVNDGTIQIDSPASVSCNRDLQIAYNVSVAAPCPAANIYAELAGLTLGPGVYCSGSEMKFSAATLTLDGQGDPNAQWIFQIATALTTATTTSFILENGAQAKNVFWAIGSSATIGYSSSFVGNIFARKAITFGSGSTISGRALALTAVSFESHSSVSLPTSTKRSLSKMETTDVPLALGGCASFAVLGGTSVNFNGVKTTIKTGSVGVSPGESFGGSYQIVAGTEENNTPLAKSCAASLATLYNQASSAKCTANHTLQSSDLAGVVLTPGVYCSATGKFEITAATVTLDAGGNPAAQWIFQTVTTVTTATATSFKLINGAQAANVFWAVGTSANIGYSSTFVGTIMAQAAINYGTSSVIVGRGLAMTAVTFESDGYISLPPVQN